MNDIEIIGSLSKIREVRVSRAQRSLREADEIHKRAISELSSSELNLNRLKIDYKNKINLIKEKYERSEKNSRALDIFRNERVIARDEITSAQGLYQLNTENLIKAEANLLESKNDLIKRFKQFEKIKYILKMR